MSPYPHYSDESNGTNDNAVSVAVGGSPIASTRVPRQSKAAPIKAKRMVVNKHAVAELRDPTPKTAVVLRRRLLKLSELGVKLPHLALTIGVSYSAAHGFITGNLNPNPERCDRYHELLTKWCRRVGAS